jgi:glycosyltransferase involved in cell wall biosynthesis
VRVAIVHDWLTGMRGGEKCLEVFCELFPSATLFTLVHRRGTLAPAIEAMEIRTSFIQSLPGAQRLHQRYLPLFPAAIERLDLSDFDFVLSSSHCVAKGAIARPGASHVCYCHTPMRYVWEFFDEYFRGPSAGVGARVVMPLAAPALRRWDVRTASRVDHFIANSEHVRGRIRRIYGREAAVVHPPVDTERFTPRGESSPARLAKSAMRPVSRDSHPERREPGDARPVPPLDTREGIAPYLVVSKLVPYKRVDLAVQAANAARAPLRVVGDGPERARLERLAGPTVSFDGWIDDGALAAAYRGARALVFPGVEDFGIVPLEAQACGTPVIAFAQGGALETVIDGRTGVLFQPQTVEGIAAAMARLDTLDLDPAAARANAERFSRPRFRDAIRAQLARWIGEEAMAAPPAAAAEAHA